jgi:hypothetical protein
MSCCRDPANIHTVIIGHKLYNIVLDVLDRIELLIGGKSPIVRRLILQIESNLLILLERVNRLANPMIVENKRNVFSHLAWEEFPMITHLVTLFCDLATGLFGSVAAFEHSPKPAV